MNGYRSLHKYTDLGDILVNLDLYHSLVSTTPTEQGCLNWLRGWHRQGYGMIGAIRKSDERRIMTVAHRVTARLKVGHAIDSQNTVVHLCSNPACQNPDHIEIGDLSLRSRTAIANGRMVYGDKQAGVTRPQNRRYKYSEDEIRFLRRATLEEIMARFGIDRGEAPKARYYARNSFRWIQD